MIKKGLIPISLATWDKELIVLAAEEKLRKKSGDNIDIWDYV
ncbi:MAG: hypothetical protein AABW46_04295 [Nanoarchaeota archaeon]